MSKIQITDEAGLVDELDDSYEAVTSYLLESGLGTYYKQAVSGWYTTGAQVPLRLQQLAGGSVTDTWERVWDEAELNDDAEQLYPEWMERAP